MYQLSTHERISEIGEAAWDALAGTASPFLRYAWLHALEETGCVRRQAGWLPMHIAIRRAPDAGGAAGELVLVAPVYLKGNSEGEFVFDHAWANFVQGRAQLDYYPKLIVAVPFTPASGPRMLIRPGQDREELVAAFVQGLVGLCRKIEVSGAHVLFPSVEQTELLRGTRLPLIERHGIQYHWGNRGYATFDDFLANFNSKRRNQIKRERRAVEEQGLELQVCSGGDLDTERIDEAFELYLTTVEKFVWGRQYLNRGFFHQIFERLPGALQVVRAVPRGTPHGRGKALAAAINLVGEDTLYGRYWGSFEERPHLHFNVCYYRGVEFCIEQGLSRFEPGAGGEHKVARGFEPTITPSFHFLTHAGVRGAIADYTARERDAIAEHLRCEGPVLKSGQRS